MTPDPSPAHTFVLRVWLERGGGADADEWRGELRRVPSGDTTFFRSLEGLAPLLARLLDSPGESRLP
jgi:hypothetical protein